MRRQFTEKIVTASHVSSIMCYPMKLLCLKLDRDFSWQKPDITYEGNIQFTSIEADVAQKLHQLFPTSEASNTLITSHISGRIGTICMSVNLATHDTLVGCKSRRGVTGGVQTHSWAAKATRRVQPTNGAHYMYTNTRSCPPAFSENTHVLKSWAQELSDGIWHPYIAQYRHAIYR